MTGDENSREELLRQFEAAISGMELADLRQLSGDLPALASGSQETSARPNLRRQPRTDVAVYRFRVDLDHASPPIWRRLEIRSDVKLDVVHQVLQAAFGWADYHLHQFSIGGGPFDRHSELFLCPYDIEEGDESGVAAATVRLDEAVQDPGDVLHYIYDYGDGWELTLRLEAVLPAADDSPTAACVDGRRAAPPEDCGGITDAEDLAQVMDDPAYFNVEEINQALRDPYFILRDAGVHPNLVDLANQLAFTEVGDDLVARLLSLTSPASEPTPEEMGAALGAYLWFLDRAGGEGIELTSAGYLKPADVEVASRLLPAMGDWIGKNNREVHAAPLLDFRQGLQAMGLLRKYKGRLLLTRAGAKMRRDPSALWKFLASRLIPVGASAFSQEASLLMLAYAATSADGTVPLDTIAEALGHLDWRRSDQRSLEPNDLYHFEHNPFDLLINVSDKPATFEDRRLSSVAVALARAALMVPTAA